MRRATGLILSALLAAASVAVGVSQPAAAQSRFKPEEIERGRYLAVAGDCTACHTKPATPGAPPSAPFAGGYPIPSPLGAIVASNITPSVQYGIGAYTEQDFERALRRGVRRDGANLYPAMPYTAYALLSDQDIHALYAYFMAGVSPVERKVAETALPFPFNLRLSMSLWNALFLKQARFSPDPARDEAWNRGAYLVEALEHCSACHSPRGLLLNESGADRFSGGSLGLWYAPNITSHPAAGIGGWSKQELARYLKTGRLPGKAAAAGGMAEAISHSLQHLTDTDLDAIATYVATLPPVAGSAFSQPGPVNAAGSADPTLRGVDWAAKKTDGAALYSGLCASCHGVSGNGSRDQAYPALVRSSTVAAERPDNIVAVILEGVDREIAGHRTLMPGFGPGSPVQALSDEQVAALATFVRSRFGGRAQATTAGDVATLRQGGEPPLLLRLIRFGMPLGAGVAILLLAAGWFRWRGRRQTLARGAAS